MKVVICDDDAIDRKKLVYCLNKLEENFTEHFEIIQYHSASLMLNSESDMDDPPDVVFLDVFMSEMNGIEAADILRQRGYNGSIIFTTSSTEHALDSYKLKADGYLVKPYTYPDFRQSVWRLIEKFGSMRKKISFVAERIDTTVALCDIVFLESVNKGTQVHITDNSYFTWKKLSEFDSELAGENNFYRLSRSFIINLDRVSQVGESCIIMNDGSAIDIPVRDKLKTKQFIIDYMTNS